MSSIRVLFYVLFLWFLASCQTTPANQTDLQPQDFTALKKSFLNDLWKTSPEFALSVGNHTYDEKLTIPNEESRLRNKAFLTKYKNLLSQISLTKLSPQDQIDHQLMMNHIESSLWYTDTFQSYKWDPSSYNVGYALTAVLEGDAKSYEDKLRAIALKMIKIPEYYRWAQMNIHQPTKEHTELAIKQNKGLAEYLRGDMKSKFSESALAPMEKQIAIERIEFVSQAIDRYVIWLQDVLQTPQKVGGFRNFRIGKELYDQKFKFDIQSSYTAAQMYQKALAAKMEVLAKMAPIAKALWPKYMGGTPVRQPANQFSMIKAVIDKVALKHTKPEKFVETIRKQIPELTKFIAEKDLISMDPEKPLKVRETPIYQRGVAGASVDSPGPFEPSRETYYNVTPLDGMSPEAQESYLREYNHYTLQILNIHEALPGHYLQLVHSNKTPSLIKSIFGNGAMIEGWAIYSERMMLENGYGAGSLELELMYYKWFLRSVTNTILDYSIHNLGLTREQALHLMINEAFQEKAEAEKKWTRATVSQVQLASYFTGFTEIYELREALKAAQGGDFNLKAFHEKFLSYGSSSVKQIKSLMF